MVFLWSLSDSKSSQVSRTLLSILASLNNAEVWMVSTRPLISISFLVSFLHQHKVVVFPWSLSDCKSPKVTSLLLNILIDLTNTVICIVKTCKLSPLILSRKEGVFRGAVVNRWPYWFMWKYEKDGCKKASPYTECCSLNSLYLTCII